MANGIPKKLLVEASALLISCTAQSWIGARRLTRVWTKIRDRSMEETVEYLDTYASLKNRTPTSFVTNPKASHETYDGIWAHQNSNLAKTNAEGNAPVGVTQVLQEVFPVTTLATLTALNRRRSVNDIRRNEFDFQDGRADELELDFPFLKPDAATETVCMTTLSEADLLTLAPAGHLFIQRKWGVDKESHTATLTLVFKVVEWNAWGHDAYAEDYKTYSSAGTNNTEERVTRTWVNIQNEDVPTATAYLRAGTATPAGYTLRSIGVSNHRNGACDITITEGVIEAGGDQFAGEEILRPFGWPECVGLREKISVEFSGYATHALLVTAISGSKTPPAGYTFTGFQDSNPGGMYARTYTYEKVTWGNYDSTTFKQVGEQNTEGNDLVQRKQACALPQDQVVAAFNAISSEANFVLTSKGISPVGNGEFSLSMAQEVTHPEATAESALIVSISQAGNSDNGSRAIQRIWFRRDEDAKDELTRNASTDPVAALGIARGSYTFDGNTYDHLRVTITDHHDGAYTVTQTLQFGYSLWYWGSRDQEGPLLADRRIVVMRVSGGVDKYERVQRSEYIKLFETNDEWALDAWAWAYDATNPSGMSNYPGVFDPKTGLDKTPEGKVRYLGNGVWEATRICYETIATTI